MRSHDLALLDQDPCQMPTELAESLGMTQQTLSERSKQFDFNLKSRIERVPYQLKLGDIERQFLTLGTVS